jgi:TLC domain
MRAPFFTEVTLAANMGIFVLTFFAFRIVLCPYLWWGIFTTCWDNRANPISQACLPWHFKYVTFVFGMFFNCLNAFWSYKILRKLLRKLSGKEKVKERNSFKDE